MCLIMLIFPIIYSWKSQVNTYYWLKHIVSMMSSFFLYQFVIRFHSKHQNNQQTKVGRLGNQRQSLKIMLDDHYEVNTGHHQSISLFISNCIRYKLWWKGKNNTEWLVQSLKTQTYLLESLSSNQLNDNFRTLIYHRMEWKSFLKRWIWVVMVE